MKLAPAALSILVLQACSERQIYDTVQRNHQLECQRYPDTRFEECMRQSDTTYEEYEDARQALEQGYP